MACKRDPNRDYAKEYRDYDGTEAVKKKRAARNKARRIMEKLGRVRKGDGKDVDHISRRKPLNSSIKNLRVRSASANRSDQ